MEAFPVLDKQFNLVQVLGLNSWFIVMLELHSHGVSGQDVENTVPDQTLFRNPTVLRLHHSPVSKDQQQVICQSSSN